MTWSRRFILSRATLIAPVLLGTGASHVLSPGHEATNRVPGDPIPDIDVTVRQNPGGQTLHTRTDANGVFSLTLIAGSYTLTIAARPASAAAAATRAPVGATLGRLVVLPDSVSAPGGWPYRLRFGLEAPAIKRIALAATFAGTAVQRGLAPKVRDIEILLDFGTTTNRGSGGSVLLGRVEARQ